jgi:hypothetical protein
MDATIITVLLVAAAILGWMAWMAASRDSYKRRHDEHFTRCWKSFQSLKAQISKADFAECHFLSKQIEDFYEEFRDMVDLRLLQEYEADLHTLLYIRKTKVRPSLRPITTKKVS